jgi:YbbR domain-containing protein
MSALRSLLTHNWELKLLSLALAYGLWVVVGQAPVVERGVAAPFAVRNLPERLELAGEIPTEIYVELRGPETRLRLLRPADVTVAVDLASAPAGNHTLRLEARHVERPPGVEVVRLVPAEVQLKLIAR